MATDDSKAPLSRQIPLTPAARQGNTSFAWSLAFLVLRLALGWTFIYHGAQKLFGVFGGPGMEGFAAYLHLPVLPAMAWAYVAALSEFVGGILVLIGFLARLGGLLIVVVMGVAIATMTGANGFGDHFDMATKQMVLGYEFNLALVAMAVALIVAGPGLISVDALIFKRGLWARGPQPLDRAERRG